MRSGIVPCGAFPGYAVPDHTGTVRRLSELQGGDPLILTLARGDYGPKEHQQHLELAASYAKVAVACTQVATIVTDDHHSLQEFRASVGAQWPFLSGPAARYASTGHLLAGKKTKGQSPCAHRYARCWGSNNRSSWHPWSTFPGWPRRSRTPVRSAR